MTIYSARLDQDQDRAGSGLEGRHRFAQDRADCRAISYVSPGEIASGCVRTESGTPQALAAEAQPS